MDLIELEQFKVDPLIDPNKMILVQSAWLQKIVREHEKLFRSNKRIEEVSTILNDKIDSLREQIQCLRMYQTLNVRV